LRATILFLEALSSTVLVDREGRGKEQLGTPHGDRDEVAEVIRRQDNSLSALVLLPPYENAVLLRRVDDRSRPPDPQYRLIIIWSRPGRVCLENAPEK